MPCDVDGDERGEDRCRHVRHEADHPVDDDGHSRVRPAVGVTREPVSAHDIPADVRRQEVVEEEAGENEAEHRAERHLDALRAQQHLPLRAVDHDGQHVDEEREREIERLGLGELGRHPGKIDAAEGERDQAEADGDLDAGCESIAHVALLLP